MSNHISGIYSITSIATSRIYIGSATRITKRKNEHFNYLLKNTHQNQHLQRIYNKYGKDDLIFSILEIIEDKSKLVEREQFWIDLLNPCINICKIAGSRLGVGQTKETRIKMSNKELPGCYYDKHYGKWKARIVINHKNYNLGSYVTEEEASQAYIKALNEYETNGTLPEKIKREVNLGRNYHFNKNDQRWRVVFRVNDKQKCFGLYKTEQDAIERVNSVREELLNNQILFDDSERKIPKGYTFNKLKNRYIVQLSINGKQRSFGSFKTEENAINKVNEIRKEIKNSQTLIESDC